MLGIAQKTAPKVRVLVVDDSVVVRRHLTETIERDPGLTVVGTAANGRLALEKIASLLPDIVTLDVEMPEMDGLETLCAIRKLYPKLPVIMCSSVTARGAAITLDALSAGAHDYVTKPAATAIGLGQTRDGFADQLLPKLRALGCRIPTSTQVRPAPRLMPTNVARNAADIVAIGVSTGGPNALAKVLSQLPSDFPVPIVIVQHMPPLFTRLLAERLSRECLLKVKEGAPGDRVLPGTIHLAPGDFHMTVFRAHGEVLIALDRAAPENSCRPAVDALFRSVATTYDGRALGVVLTGMGQDGLRGCEALHAKGSQILVQDEASSVVWGMPGFVAQSGLADDIVALDGMATAIQRRISKGGRR